MMPFDRLSKASALPGSTTRYTLLSAVLMLLLAACGGQVEEVAAPTAVPQLPVLTMLVPPLEIDADSSDEADFSALEAEVQKRSGLLIDIQRMTRYADALKAVCDTRSTVTIAWLDGMTTAAALAQDCGVPALQIARVPEVQLVNADGTLVPTEEADAGTGDTATATPEVTPTEETGVEAAATEAVLPANALTGLPGVIVVNSQFGKTDLALVEDRTFCRLNSTDFYSWLLPTLVFKAQNIDLTGANVTVVDYDSTGALLDAVSTGDCALAGVSQAVVDAGLPEDVEIAQTTPSFPFDVLVYPVSIDSGLRTTLSNTLVTMASDPQTAALLAPLLHQVALLPAATDNFTDLQGFIASTGVNLADLGK